MASASVPLRSLNGASLRAAEPPLLELDLETYEVLVQGHRVELTHMELRLLEALAKRPSAVVTKSALLRDVWDYQLAGRTRTVDAHACRLRTKLGLGARLVLNVRGVGYRLVAPGDPGRVCLGERPSAGEVPPENVARPLALVRGLAPDAELSRVWLSGVGRAEPVLALGSRVDVARRLIRARDEGSLLVELPTPVGAPASVSPDHVALVEDAGSGARA